MDPPEQNYNMYKYKHPTFSFYKTNPHLQIGDGGSHSTNQTSSAARRSLRRLVGRIRGFAPLHHYRFALIGEKSVIQKFLMTSHMYVYCVDYSLKDLAENPQVTL
jgi:hypothetical protein